MSEPVLIEIGKRYRFNVNNGTLGYYNDYLVGIYDNDSNRWVERFGYICIESTIVDITKSSIISKKIPNYITVYVSNIEYL